MSPDKWDLGEFAQKDGIATRWGTKDELLDAVSTAKKYGIHILIDAVLNVRPEARKLSCSLTGLGLAQDRR
jgi:hypothetical protein